MALISFGKLQKKIYLIIIMIIENVIYLFGRHFGRLYYNDIIFDFIKESGPMIAGIILFFIFKNKTDKKSKKGYKELIILFILKTIKCCYECFYFYFIQEESHNYGLLSYTINAVEILFMSIISYFLLKYKYYIHHIITIILSLLLGIVSGLILDSYSKFEYDYLFIFIIYLLNDMFILCYFKYMMDELYYHYSELLILYGLFGLVIKIFIFLLLITIEYKTENFQIINSLKDYFDTNDVVHLIFYQCLFFLILEAAYYLLILLILFYLSPNHIIINDVIQGYLYLFILDDNPNKYYGFIFLGLQLFILLFYFEILEFNFLGLNRNTQKNIQKRERIDVNKRNATVVSEIELEKQYIIIDKEMKSKDNDDENDENDNGEKEDLLFNYDSSNKKEE